MDPFAPLRGNFSVTTARLTLSLFFTHKEAHICCDGLNEPRRGR
jgi:hypothetical protein